MDHFWHFSWTFVHSKCKRSSLRSQCWMRLFLWFSTTVFVAVLMMIERKLLWPPKKPRKFLLAKLLKLKMASFLETTRIRGLNGQEDKVSLTFFSFPDFEDYFEWKNKIFCLFFLLFRKCNFFLDFYPLWIIRCYALWRLFLRSKVDFNVGKK